MYSKTLNKKRLIKFEPFFNDFDYAIIGSKIMSRLIGNGSFKMSRFLESRFYVLVYAYAKAEKANPISRKVIIKPLVPFTNTINNRCKNANHPICFCQRPSKNARANKISKSPFAYKNNSRVMKPNSTQCGTKPIQICGFCNIDMPAYKNTNAKASCNSFFVILFGFAS